MLMRLVRKNTYWCVFTGMMVVLAVACFPWRRPPGMPLEEVFAAEAIPLRAAVHVEFEGMPLEAVFEAMAREAHCQVAPAWDRLKEGGVARDSLVTAHARGTVTLEEAITMILTSFAEPWTNTRDVLRNWVRYETVVVGGNGGAPTGPVTVVYEVSDLVYRPDFEEQEQHAEKFVTLVRGLLAETLGENGATLECLDDKLVVKTSRAGQRRVAELLMKLRGG